MANTVRRDAPRSAVGPVTVEVINLDGRQTLRARQGPYLVGYFTDTVELGRHVDLSLVTIKGE